MRAQSVEGVFGRSWQLLTHNWVLIVPGLIIGIVVGLAQAVFGTPGDQSSGGSLAGAAGAFVANIVLTVIALLGAIANTAYTTGMAGAAWERGTTTLDDGAAAFDADAGNVFVATIGLFVLGIVAAILALPTLGLSFLAFYVFFIYTIAGGRGRRAQRGLDALGESFGSRRRASGRR